MNAHETPLPAHGEAIGRTSGPRTRARLTPALTVLEGRFISWGENRRRLGREAMSGYYASTGRNADVTRIADELDPPFAPGWHARTFTVRPFTLRVYWYARSGHPNRYRIELLNQSGARASKTPGKLPVDEKRFMDILQVCIGAQRWLEHHRPTPMSLPLCPLAGLIKTAPPEVVARAPGAKPPRRRRRKG